MSEGCTNLGLYYEDGRSVAKDLAKAVERFKTGCTLGNDLGCKNLSRVQWGAP